MSELFEPETLRKIRTFVSKNPGLPLSKIAEMLDMKIAIVERYLSSMQNKGEITVSLDDGFPTYYISKSGTKYENRKILETRQRVYDIVSENPGLHLSKIAEMLDMSVSLAEYHLLHIEKNHQIMVVKGVGGYYKRYYMRDSEVGTNEAKILAVLRQEILLKIVIMLWKKPNLQHKELLKKFDISPSTLSYHINKLIENDIVDKISYGAEKGYSLKNEKEIIWIIRRYKLDKSLDRFKDMWEDLSV